jgi:uroporphyrinogen-III synthase
MRIWVTRTAPANQQTGARLRDMGHEAVCTPVLAVRRLPAELPCNQPQGIVFTSRNGVLHHPLDAGLLDVPVFAVGASTADMALRAGYSDVRSADGDVRDLQRLILGSLSSPSRLLHFAGRDVAGDLIGFLRRFGHLVERRCVYVSDAVPMRWLLDVRSSLPTIDGILAHSPRGASRVARVLRGTGWRGKIWCISEACALELVGVPGIDLRFTNSPDEAALVAMVGQADETLRAPTPTRSAARHLTLVETESRIVRHANDNDPQSARPDPDTDDDDPSPPAA